MRLIDADALMKDHCDECKLDTQAMCKSDPICGTMMWIVDAPTVDAEPVKHAMWNERIIGNGWDYWGEFTCSACAARYEKLDRKKLNYCPNCGAKMDKELEDER